MNISNGSVYLMVGDLYFGDDVDEIKTLLGSCVAITLWHPRLKHGGMSHIILPEADPSSTDDPNDTRYAGGAVHAFMKKITGFGMKPSQYQVGLYGGGRMFATGDAKTMMDVGMRNVRMTRSLLEQHGFKVDQEDAGGEFYRHVHLNLHTGDVNVRATPVSKTMG
ncbi:MAG: chemotaxis protein CheD [Gammaproteobacteria bacterium]|nr:chemotaxis protein CheD [Gammaproteobacteria bacterium]MDH5693207.1 chemotaxis protein CheD [Gammaproteobacteria bacterium]